MKWQAADETAPEATVENLDPAQPNREELISHKQWLIDQRDFYSGLAHQLADERDEREAKDRVGYSTVAKLGEVALKFERASMEIILKQGDEEFAAWLVEEKRRLLNRGSH